MELPDTQILTTCIHWLKNNKSTYLVTIVKTFGSSPRPVGSIMAINNHGEIEGSVSGGCLEADLCEKIVRGIESLPKPIIHSVGIDQDLAHQYGLPCGGKMELVLEQLHSSAQCQSILDSIASNQRIYRHICLTTGEVSLHTTHDKEPFQYTGDIVKRLFGPSWLMLVIGAGHLPGYVSQIALSLNFEVIVCDPRDKMADQWRVPNTTMVTLMPDDAVQKYITHERCAVVALTHDPKLDGMALMNALESPAFYIGALGSRTTNSKRIQNLKQLGLPERAIERLHGPIGLSIGSRTPAEIAVSILAQVILERNKLNQSTNLLPAEKF